jgi:hypothetical protein
MGPVTTIIENSDSASDDFAFGHELSRSACDMGISGPATAPCNTRASSRIGKVGAIPHSHDANTNNRIEPTNRRT